MSGPGPGRPPTPCLYPSVSSFLLSLRCVCHLVWLHIWGYPPTKLGQQLPLCRESFSLRGTCHGLKHFPIKKKKKGSLFIVSTAKCSMLCSIYLNIIYAYWHRCGSALEYPSATTTEEEAFQQPDSNSYYDVSHLVNRELIKKNQIVFGRTKEFGSIIYCSSSCFSLSH